MCPTCTRDTDGIAAKLLRCRIASEALRRNMPLRFDVTFAAAHHKLCLSNHLSSLFRIKIRSSRGAQRLSFFHFILACRAHWCAALITADVSVAVTDFAMDFSAQKGRFYDGFCAGLRLCVCVCVPKEWTVFATYSVLDFPDNRYPLN